MSFSERLKKLRLREGLTQEMLGQKINVSKVSISGYESGNRKPDIDTLQRLADFFNVSVDYLMDRPIHESIDDPAVEFIMRAKEDLSPEAYEQFLKMVKKMKKAFEDDDN